MTLRCRNCGNTGISPWTRTPCGCRYGKALAQMMARNDDRNDDREEGKAMAEPISDERLVEIRARVESASPGPWKVDMGSFVMMPAEEPEDIYDFYTVAHAEMGPGDAEFIANARQDVPALVDEVITLREQCKQLRHHLANVLEDAEVFGWETEAVQSARAYLSDRTQSSREEGDDNG